MKWQQTSVNEWTSECGAYLLRGGHADGNYWRAYSGERLIAASCDRNFVEIRCDSELAASTVSANGYATTKASHRCETGT